MNTNSVECHHFLLKHRQDLDMPEEGGVKPGLKQTEVCCPSLPRL